MKKNFEEMSLRELLRYIEAEATRRLNLEKRGDTAEPTSINKTNVRTKK